MEQVYLGSTKFHLSAENQNTKCQISTRSLTPVDYKWTELTAKDRCKKCDR